MSAKAANSAAANRQLLPPASCTRSEFYSFAQVRKNHRSAAGQLTYAVPAIRRHALLSLLRNSDCIPGTMAHLLSRSNSPRRDN